MIDLGAVCVVCKFEVEASRIEVLVDACGVEPMVVDTEEGERNVMLNASDANKPREIQIGLPSEDVNVYENGLPAVPWKSFCPSLLKELTE